MATHPRVVFVCTANSCRSQMGEGWARHLLGKQCTAASAGVKPGTRLDPLAIKVMAEVGIDISSHYPKTLDDVTAAAKEASGGTDASPFDLAITVCAKANDQCPNFRGAKRIVHVGYEDPPALAAGSPDPLPFYRQIRDEIGEFVKERLPGLLGLQNLTADTTTEEANPLAVEAVLPKKEEEVTGTPAAGFDEKSLLEAEPATPTAAPEAAPPAIGVFEKYLTVWVLLCMITGGIIGYFAPSVADGLATATISDISIPVAILLWCMIFPMLVQIDFAAVLRVREKPGALLLTSAINYLVKPFTMYALSILFFRAIYVNILDKELQDQYIAGCVILAGAPCTAMVFVWSLLMGGDGAYTLMQVAVNDLLMLALYTPTVMLLLGVSSIPLPYDTIVIAVVLFIVAPLIISAGIRSFVSKYGGLGALDRVITRFKPVTIIALLATLVLIFIFQGQKIGNKPLDIVLVAIPIIMQTVLNFCICYALGYANCIEHVRLGPASLIATSNFFELAVAVAISVYGLQSGAALATVVGVLVEVPVMLALVHVCNWLRPRLDKRIDTCDCSWQKRCCPGQQRTLPMTAAD